MASQPIRKRSRMNVKAGVGITNPKLSSLPRPDGVVSTTELLGKGGYGQVSGLDCAYTPSHATCAQVFKGTVAKTGEIVAVKIMEIEAGTDEENYIAQELEVLERFSAHRNIARYYSAFLTIDRRLWLVMELCAYGSAADLTQAIRFPKADSEGE